MQVQCDRWVVWDSDLTNLKKFKYGNHGDLVPLDKDIKLASVTAIQIQNFSSTLDISLLEKDFPKVTKLKLKTCDVALSNEIFSGLQSKMMNIKELELWPDNADYSCEDLNETVDFSMIKAFPSLERFQLWHLKFKSIKGKIDGSQTLKVLVLRNTGVEQLSSDCFESLSQLKNLNLEDNHLKVLEQSIFEKNVQLEELYLNNNRLSSLPEQIFQQNTKLKTLFIPFNKITELPQQLLSALNDLEEFSVAINQISTIPVDFFKNNQKLRAISFTGNKIKHLDPQLFVGLKSLQIVSFKRNQLTSMDALFKQNSQLKEVFFDNNQIYKVAPGIFHDEAPLEKSNFFDNPCTGTFWRPPQHHHHYTFGGRTDLTKCYSNWTNAEDLQQGE